MLFKRFGQQLTSSLSSLKVGIFCQETLCSPTALPPYSVPPLDFQICSLNSNILQDSASFTDQTACRADSFDNVFLEVQKGEKLRPLLLIPDGVHQPRFTCRDSSGTCFYE